MLNLNRLVVISRADGLPMFTGVYWRDTVTKLYLLYHCVAFGLIAAAIIAKVTGVVGWIGFIAWIILTVALYVGGYFMVMRDREPWDIDFDL